MSTLVEKPIPGMNGFFAREDGIIRGPNGIMRMRPNNCGYDQIWLRNPMNKKQIYKLVHRLVAKAWVHNPCPETFGIVDHIDHDPSNNKPENLRWVTQQLNCLNSDKPSGCHYVRKWHKWIARLGLDNKSKYLGAYKTEAEAHEVYKSAKAQAFKSIYNKHVHEAPQTGPSFLRD